VSRLNDQEVLVSQSIMKIINKDRN